MFEDLKLPDNKLFFYTSFVSTIDGKIMVLKDGYWPLGSETDYEFFTYLRAHADVIIDGKNTALAFGNRTIDRLHNSSFQELRQNLGKTKQIQYIIITSKPDESLIPKLQNSYGYKPLIITTEESNIHPELEKICHIQRLPSTITGKVSLEELASFLEAHTYQKIFIDGGPHLIGSLLSHDLLHEVFLTITPKIVGSEIGKTLTMVEGRLFSPESIKTLKLCSVEQKGDEVFLRYQKK